MSNQSKRIVSKREGVLRLSLFIILLPLIYTVQGYSWAVILISLAALYSLISGVFRLIGKE
ncbi:hypothetical protein [Paenibacillus macquariensis]|uniref:Phosphatidate cytidylyltransferase n=1 Tax=Paenibacillus macquariensis TaxID=948756 RepID=A0ABY1K1B6_9BACL|nr:hypothetical protein [Paenibacillus macquariensis]MEC0091796.1 hypothetical protein [Paenibacillus macquariensis]OAB32292.1 hypothetical protein PMSM_16925 [Paenibacillus macquariensis subsp. macquariensis]SIR11816.1 hypothetical protein SAMN05421578_107119 [Paenibacillus macquariensis]